MSYRRIKMPQPGQVYADEPSELFRPSLPAWPLGRAGGLPMGYVDDGSSGSRGVGAVASRDLKPKAGVRTMTGVVTLNAASKRKPPVVPRRGPAMQHPFTGSTGKAVSYGAPLRQPLPSVLVKPSADREGRKRRPGIMIAKFPPPPKLAPLACTAGFFRTPSGGCAPAGSVAPGYPGGAPIKTTSGATPAPAGAPTKGTPFVNGGGGAATGPDQDEFASSSEQAIQEAEAAAKDAALVEAAAAPAAKPPMSTGTKVVVGLGVGWALLSLLGGGL